MYNTGMVKECSKCGICCKLFLINLNEVEYKSGKYKTMFEKFGIIENFSEAKKYGINILSQNKDGSCVYLKNNSCKIYKDRPRLCRIFFCTSKSKKFEKMRQAIGLERLKSRK